MEPQHLEAFFCGWRLGVPVKTCPSQSIERIMKPMKDFVRAAKEGGLECNAEKITQSCTLVNPGPLSPSLCDQICINQKTNKHPAIENLL